MARVWNTSRLALRQLGPQDAAAVCEYGLRTREFHRKWEPVRPDDWWDRDVVAERLEVELAEALADRGLTLYLFERGGTRVIGRVVLMRIQRGSMQRAEIGYGLAFDAQGHGYMSEALRELCRIAFDDLLLHRLEINILPENARSIALAERCGFLHEGVSRDAYRIAGEWRDHLRYARLSTDAPVEVEA